MSGKDKIKTFLVKKPLKLDCGQTISDFPLAYETYGKLNDKKDNGILIFHALTGDQFASGMNPITRKDGWWNYALYHLKVEDYKENSAGYVYCGSIMKMKLRGSVGLLEKFAISQDKCDE